MSFHFTSVYSKDKKKERKEPKERIVQSEIPIFPPLPVQPFFVEINFQIIVYNVYLSHDFVFFVSINHGLMLCL